MKRRYDGSGTDAIVRAHCEDCGCELERTNSAVKMAQRAGRGFACKSCTADRRWQRRVDWTGHARFVPETLAQPIKWKKPRRIFVNSMSDLFHPSLTNEEIAAVFGVMAACPQHTFQVLTKRPMRALEWFRWIEAHDPEVGAHTECHWHALNTERPACDGPVHRKSNNLEERPWPLPNVYLGVSVEDQKTADERIPLLLQCPAAIRWVSAEPLLGPVDLAHLLHHEFQPGNPEHGHHRQCSAIAPDNLRHCGYPPEAHPMPGIDWVVVGGESGPGARPCNVEWIRSIVGQCKGAWVPVFVKQLGGFPRVAMNQTDFARTVHVGPDLFADLRSSKGADPSEWPEDLRVREMPEVANG